MKKTHKVLSNIIFTCLILLVFFCISLYVEKVFKAYSLVPAIFTLAVFVVALVTDGYVYGIIASLVSMLAVNYAFTFPYFTFNFLIPENLVSAIIMLFVTVVSSALITKVRQQEKIKVETSKEKMRANLLRAVSHDLRTPLTTIYGSSATILDQYDNLTKEQIMKLTVGIKEDAQWLVGMVENLLTVTRIDNDNMKLKKSPVVVEELIDAVLIRFRKRYPEQKIEISIPDEFIMIPMDAVLIEQVIVNLLENAVQHADGMTTLELNVTTSGGEVIFEVADDGCGISKERMENIFTGYFEKKNSHVDHQKSSMGIGLSVCASIIKAHEGTISVENRTSGGSCFRFALGVEDDVYEQQV